MRLTCEELVERVFDAPDMRRLSELTLLTYRNAGVTPLLEHFSSKGLRYWSARHAVAYLRALREGHEAGAVSGTRFRATRKMAALVNEMDAVGFLSGNVLPDWRDENPLVLLFDPARCETVAAADAGIYSLAAKVSVEVARAGIHLDKSQRCMVSRELSRMVAFFVERGLDTYSDDLLPEYAEHLKGLFERGDITSARLLGATRVVTYAESVAGTGALEWRTLKRGVAEPASSESERILEGFSRHLASAGLAPGTVRNYANAARQLIRELERRGVDVPLGITSKTARDAVVAIRVATGKPDVPNVSGLRRLGGYLAAEHPGATDFSAAIPPSPPSRRRALRGFDAEQSRKLLEAPDRSTSIGKRDFAILSLSHITAMRPCDVVTLELESIDWRQNCIRFVQQKTSEPLAIPLDLEAGNAIATYILEARPDTEDRRVFVRSVRPYVGLSRDAVRNVIVKYGHVLGDDPGVSLGPRSFRLGFAAGATKAGVTIDGARDLMGHKDRGTTRGYIAPDLDRLKMCPLDLGGIPTGRKELL